MSLLPVLVYAFGRTTVERSDDTTKTVPKNQACYPTHQWLKVLRGSISIASTLTFGCTMVESSFSRTMVESSAFGTLISSKFSKVFVKISPKKY